MSPTTAISAHDVVREAARVALASHEHTDGLGLCPVCAEAHDDYGLSWFECDALYQSLITSAAGTG